MRLLLLRDDAIALEPIVEDHAGDGQPLWDTGEGIVAEPTATRELRPLEMDLTLDIIGIEAHHQSARVGPGLRAEVAEVVDG